MKPQPLNLEPSFGFGDRLGLATPGHVEALRRSKSKVCPIFAQQSIREMARTGRSPEEVMADARRGADAANYNGVQGADGDHLKTPADVKRVASAGFCFFTIDPSDHVDGEAGTLGENELRERFQNVRDQADWVARYQSKTVRLSSGTTLNFSEEVCLRAAVKYGRALRHTSEMARHIAKTARERNQEFEIELSVDETPQPTTLEEHYIVAAECRRADVNLVSLAPRFGGEWEKGVDFKGDTAEFERVLRDHAAIADELGPYKLSLHSGSDKLSVYSAFARATNGRFHVKTAGTSYLEALRVAAREDESLFRAIVQFSRERYNEDRATYHVSAQREDAPAPDEVSDVRDLERHYLGLWDETPAGHGFTQPGRQILHTTFGSVLNHEKWGRELRELLHNEAALYHELLAQHFERHLKALA